MSPTEYLYRVHAFLIYFFHNYTVSEAATFLLKYYLKSVEGGQNFSYETAHSPRVVPEPFDKWHTELVEVLRVSPVEGLKPKAFK